MSAPSSVERSHSPTPSLVERPDPTKTNRQVLFDLYMQIRKEQLPVPLSLIKRVISWPLDWQSKKITDCFTEAHKMARTAMEATALKRAEMTQFPFFSLFDKDVSRAKTALKKSIDESLFSVPYLFLKESDDLNMQELASRYQPFCSLMSKSGMIEAAWDAFLDFQETHNSMAGALALWFIKMATGASYEIPSEDCLQEDSIKNTLSYYLRFKCLNASLEEKIAWIELLFGPEALEPECLSDIFHEDTTLLLKTLAQAVLSQASLDELPSQGAIVANLLLAANTKEEKEEIANWLASNQDPSLQKAGTLLLQIFNAQDTDPVAPPFLWHELEQYLPPFSEAQREALFGALPQEARLPRHFAYSDPHLELHRYESPQKRGKTEGFFVAFQKPILPDAKSVWTYKFAESIKSIQPIGTRIALEHPHGHFTLLDKLTGKASKEVHIPCSITGSGIVRSQLGPNGIYYHLMQVGTEYKLIIGRWIEGDAEKEALASRRRQPSSPSSSSDALDEIDHPEKIEWIELKQISAPSRLFLPLETHAGIVEGQWRHAKLHLVSPSGETIIVPHCPQAAMCQGLLYTLETGPRPDDPWHVVKRSLIETVSDPLATYTVDVPAKDLVTAQQNLKSWIESQILSRQIEERTPAKEA